jgi:SdrD B-like domain
MARSRQQRPRSLQYEVLEPRQVMTAGVTAALTSGVLHVSGTDAADNIAFRQVNGKISIVGVSGSWSTTKVKSVSVSALGGNDSISLDSVANGGNRHLSRNVTIYSGTGTDSVHVSSGHDVSFSGLGHTLVVRPDGTATLDGAAVNWTPSPPLPATLSGTKWEDYNGNSVRDAGDQGLAGWHILINGVDRATTDVNGNWTVSNLTPGTYSVQEVAQNGWT